MAEKAFRFFKEACTSNLKLKLLSLAVAFSIWSFTALSRETRYELILPVEIRNIPSGFAVAAPPPREVHFSLSGPSILIDGVRRANSSLVLSLRGAVAGKTLFSNLETKIKVPDDVRVTRISPANVEMELVRQQQSIQEGEQQ